MVSGLRHGINYRCGASVICGISDFIQSFIVTEERVWNKKPRLIHTLSQSINTEKRARDVQNFFIIRSNLNHSYACEASCKGLIGKS